MTDADRIHAALSALAPGKPDDAALNLQGALYDLKRLNADRVCINTIERAAGQVAEAQRCLEAMG